MNKTAPCVLVATLAISLQLCCTSCASQASRHDRLVKKITALYADTFESVKPGYVWITYPESVAALSGVQRVEFDVVSGLLRDRRIDWDHRKHSELLKLIGGKRAGTKYRAYDLPLAIARVHKGEPIIYLILGEYMPEKTKLHPNAKKFGVDVLVLGDPCALIAAQ